MSLRIDFVTPSVAESCGAFALREISFGAAGLRTGEDSSIGCFHLVVLDGTRVVGYGKLVVDDQLARIKQICIDETMRRGGLGSRILERLIDRAREHRVATVWLLARFTALGFYRRYGFAEIGPVVPSEDSAAPHRRMELQVAS